GMPAQLTPTLHTTSDAVSIHRQLAALRALGAECVSMEVSSHALDQGRVNGVRFNTAAFTNLTRDHLDYHGTMEAYGAAKARLFAAPGLAHRVINVDDPFGARLAEEGSTASLTVTTRAAAAPPRGERAHGDVRRARAHAARHRGLRAYPRCARQRAARGAPALPRTAAGGIRLWRGARRGQASAHGKDRGRARRRAHRDRRQPAQRRSGADRGGHRRRCAAARAARDRA